jgi:hypothetical protein
MVWGRARYLEPVNGIWLQEDPRFASVRHAYARGRALVMIDPTGRAEAVSDSFLRVYLVGAKEGGLQAIFVVDTALLPGANLSYQLAMIEATGLTPFYVPLLLLPYIAR